MGCAPLLRCTQNCMIMFALCTEGSRGVGGWGASSISRPYKLPVYLVYSLLITVIGQRAGYITLPLDDATKDRNDATYPSCCCSAGSCQPSQTAESTAGSFYSRFRHGLHHGQRKREDIRCIQHVLEELYDSIRTQKQARNISDVEGTKLRHRWNWKYDIDVITTKLQQNIHSGCGSSFRALPDRMGD